MGRELRQLERDVLPEFLSRQRWFAGKSANVKRAQVTLLGAIPGNPNQLLFLEAETGTGPIQLFDDKFVAGLHAAGQQGVDGEPAGLVVARRRADAEDAHPVHPRSTFIRRKWVAQEMQGS